MSNAMTYVVPPDAEQARCSKCKRPIFFVRTLKGAAMPVDCEAPGMRAPMLGSAGVGVSHFTTCEHANYFSGRNKR